MKKTLSVALALVLALGCLTACGGSDSSSTAAAAAVAEAEAEAAEDAADVDEAEVEEVEVAEVVEASGELNIYTTVSDLQFNALVGTFEELYPDIQVNYTQAGAGESKSRIIAEVDNPQADVMFGGLVYADTLSMGDYFAEYVSPNDVNLPDEFKNTTGVLTYHDTQIPVLWVNDELEEEAGITITSYADLLDPALDGNQIVSADPTSSSSAWNQLQCILTDFGGWESDDAWDYIQQLLDKGTVIVDSSSSVYRGVYNGEYTVGLTYEPACVQMLEEEAEGVHIIYPDEGVTSIAFGSAMIKGCKNPENAGLFLDFLISDEGQVIYNECGARQANSYLDIDNPWLPSLDTIVYNVADTEALAVNQEEILDRWREATKQ